LRVDETVERYRPNHVKAHVITSWTSPTMQLWGRTRTMRIVYNVPPTG